MARSDLQPVYFASATAVAVYCKGNTCRSSMFAELLRRVLKRKKRKITVISAGCMDSACSGEAAAPEWATLLEETGVDLSTHRSQGITQIDPGVLRDISLHLSVDPVAAQVLEEKRLVEPDRIFLINPPNGVANPWDVKGDGRLGAYRSCFREMCGAIDTMLGLNPGFTARVAKEP